MFKKNFLILIFTTSFLGACDMQEKSLKNDSDTIKKIFACGFGIGGILASEKTAWLNKGDKAQLCYFGSCFKPDTIILLCANFKYIPFVLVNKQMISWDNGQRLFKCISVLHGASAGYLSYKALNRFFPS